MSAELFTHGEGLSRLMLWRTEDGQWHYDGPSFTKGRGPNYRGEVTDKEAAMIKRAIKRAKAKENV